MITPSYALTATERVLPKLALDFTTGILDSRVSITRALNTATAINNSGLIAVVNANLPRFDYDPVTLASKGLLIEEARTNLATYSEDFSNVSWLNSGLLAFGSGSTVNATAAPDGTTTADLITEDTSTGAHRVFRAFVLIPNTACSFSFFVKRASGTRNVFVIVQIGADLLYCRVNLTNGTIIQQGTGGTASGLVVSVQQNANSFYRVSISGIVSTTVTNPFCQIYLNNTATADGPTAPSYTGDGTSGIFIWGAQFETGAFPTSYIPTVAATVTRNADVATMTGTNFSSWFNASQGTFVASGFTSSATSGQILTTVQSPYNGNELFSLGRALKGGLPTGGFSVNASGQYLVLGDQTNGNSPVNSFVKMAGAYVTANCAGKVGTFATETSAAAVTMPATQALMQIGNLNNGSFWNGWVSKINYYNIRVTNNEIAAFTF